MTKAHFPRLLHRKFLLPSIALLTLATGAGVTQWAGLASDTASLASAVASDSRADEPVRSSPAAVHLGQERWAASGVELQPARRSTFSRSVKLNGKIGLNEDRVAHIFPMVEGVVDSVHVRLGQRVKANDLLVVIQSREVGRVKLDLYQARLQQERARISDQRTRQIAENTGELIDSLRDNSPIDTIETDFRDRPMGEYRQQLLSAYANYYKSQTDVERLESLGDSGAVAAKRLVSAEAARNVDRATFQASLEQIHYDLETSILTSSQAVKESETRVAVAETSLKILGYQQDDLASINPAEEGEAIAHYPIRAPFDGTVLSKDVALLEHTRPDVQLLTVADLSTVWVTADVYEEHLPLLQSLGDGMVTVRSEAWPGRSFEAKVFARGEIMDESTRTIAMRATADNRDGYLKPGMFVSVELPGVGGEAVLQLPRGSIQEHEGQTFVFVHLGEDRFERRDVTVGRAAKESVEILDGIEADETIVVSGGFVLKSRMFADLMEGD